MYPLQTAQPRYEYNSHLFACIVSYKPHLRCFRIYCSAISAFIGLDWNWCRTLNTTLASHYQLLSQPAAVKQFWTSVRTLCLQTSPPPDIYDLIPLLCFYWTIFRHQATQRPSQHQERDPRRAWNVDIWSGLAEDYNLLKAAECCEWSGALPGADFTSDFHSNAWPAEYYLRSLDSQAQPACSQQWY